MKSILLVEDDQFIADIYSMQLKEAGYSFDIAIDGKMALSRIENHLPDLLILDINLPKMSGWQVLDVIRQDEKLKNLKVIVISNINPKDCEKEIKKYNISNYFLKVQTTFPEILQSVKEILN